MTGDRLQFLKENGELKTIFYTDEKRYELSLPGRFNVYNALAALQSVRCFGFDPEKAGKILAKLRVRGRMERVAAGEGISCYIDYAHNAMSLQEVLSTLRLYRPERILLVFGCGGDRAGSRRTKMGKVAGKFADLTIITSDNPRWEDPEKIIGEIVDGISKTNGRYRVIPDRAEAIRLAAELTQPGDVLLIAGKGHENYQEIRGVRYPMDDRQLVREAVRAAAQKEQKKEQAECTQTLL